MKPGSMKGAARIAPNDPTGAHAVTAGALSIASQALATIVVQLGGLGLADGDAFLRRVFGRCVIAYSARRIAGPMAHACWQVLIPESVDHAHLIEIEYDKRRRHGWLTPWASRSLGVYVTQHALARCCQRTVGVGDLDEIVPAIEQHVMQAQSLLAQQTVRGGDELQTIDAAGVMLWHACSTLEEPIALRAGTWLADQTVIDPKLRGLVARAKATHTLLVRRGALLRPAAVN